MYILIGLKNKEKCVENGRNLLDKEIRKRKLSINEVLSEENIEKILKELKVKDIEEVYLALGSLRYTPSSIINITLPETKSSNDIVIEKMLEKGLSQAKIALKLGVQRSTVRRFLERQRRC